MTTFHLSTAVIVAADTHAKRVLGWHATTSLKRLLRHINDHLHLTMQDVTLNDIELAFGWLIEKERIELRCQGTNILTRYRGSDPLVFEVPKLRLSFDDIPTFKRLRKADLELQEAERKLAQANRKRREAYLALLEAHTAIQQHTTIEPLSALR